MASSALADGLDENSVRKLSRRPITRPSSILALFGVERRSLVRKISQPHSWSKLDDDATVVRTAGSAEFQVLTRGLPLDIRPQCTLARIRGNTSRRSSPFPPHRHRIIL